ncbi:homoserine O-succinyltransferase MetA [Methylicorpusculum sp.]|uniref:homoserine O-succinyltransferase MetA n=1 Tax=Methylicorpusculum sp. TaxID=2713644 RepID=UPI00272F3DC9|nr:homoserine O-succinyltransferase [Methylicorpusculum sp.]MDP2179459.1 homoserine O-succinyltransferase [Methylicorpusculum sp.]MDP3529401.1 homoserine O-succinyltransferase [Methylicorpusculum sp.]MDZ4150132.1 homoserine O-succinyltransferase [Methylicorpusculum sp.]
MPLVAYNDLPSFERLRAEGEEILTPERASRQDIREMHIGLLNMMPDAALEATERQFFRLVGACNQITQFHVHPFTIEGLPRSPQAQMHIDRYYESFDTIKNDGLDALIISGANVTHPKLDEEAFWQPLSEVFDWAKQNVPSVLCSCLATHALIQYCYGIERTPLPAKRWGVFPHKVLDRTHPLVAEINTRFDVPHSRFNEIFQADMEAHGLKILVAGKEAGVHLATSPDGFRIVFFQGHPEYDDISLLKEYKREVLRFYHAERDDYPPFPENYFNAVCRQLLEEYKEQVIAAKNTKNIPAEFPEALLLEHIDNTWRDTAKAVFNNWLGKIYQITDQDRRVPFMTGIDPENPLGL